MTKSEIISAIAARNKIPVAKVETVVDGLLEIIALSLAMDEPVKFINFGTFGTRHREAMILRDPRDGRAIEVAPRIGVTFKAAPTLRSRVDPLYRKPMNYVRKADRPGE